ncbi:MAG: hypothetical protein D6805_07605 [Planctomycetota bacterium]|nr:MAG: hypothetical protein D6805_07605 [Planctomycetota bacterium]
MTKRQRKNSPFFPAEPTRSPLGRVNQRSPLYALVLKTKGVRVQHLSPSREMDGEYPKDAQKYLKNAKKMPQRETKTL